jgi:predicted RecB family nuclease
VSVSGPLTFQVLDGYLHCRYLGFLRIAGQRGEISEYATSLDIRRASVRTVALERIARQFGDDVLASHILLTPDVLRRGARFLLDANLQRGDISIRFDGLQRVPGSSAVGDFHYVPVLFGADRHLHRTDRALLELLGVLLSDVQGIAPTYGLVYHGSDCRLSKLRLSPDLSRAKNLMGELWRLQRGEVQPRLVLNNHCPTCEFSLKCHEQAVREDNLSLLRGFEHTVGEVTEKIADIKRMLGGHDGTGTQTPSTRRPLSAAARARIAAGQRKRWAAQKKQQGQTAATAKQSSPKNRRISAAGRKRMAEATRKRWAEYRAKKAKA